MACGFGVVGGIIGQGPIMHVASLTLTRHREFDLAKCGQFISKRAFSLEE